MQIDFFICFFSVIVYLMNVFRFEFVWILYTTPVRIWCASGMYIGGSECYYGDGTNPQNCDRSHKNDRTYVRFVPIMRLR